MKIKVVLRKFNFFFFYIGMAESLAGRSLEKYSWTLSFFSLKEDILKSKEHISQLTFKNKTLKQFPNIFKYLSFIFR